MKEGKKFSRSAVATPSKKGLRCTPKKRATPRKLTHGKQHRMLAPETPTNKIIRRKSDGQLRVPETPDYTQDQQCKTTPRRVQASMKIRKKASFYSGAGSRNAQRAEGSMNASLIQGNVSFNNSMFVNANESKRENFESGGELNKSSILFPHLAQSR